MSNKHVAVGHQGHLHVLPAGERQPLQRRRPGPDPAPRLRAERQDHPAGLGPQPRARRARAAVSRRQHRGDARGPAAAQGLLRGLPAEPGLQPAAAAHVGPVFTRFDSMKTPCAALVWDRVLPLQELDRAAILAFYQQWGEQLNPELQCRAGCARPSPSPSPGRARARPRARAGARRRAPARARPPARARARRPPPARADRPPVLALVKTDAGPGLDLREVPTPVDRHQRRPDPRPQDGDLRHGPPHRVVGSAGRPRPSTRRSIVGHEFVGEIVEVGSNVADFHAGRPRLAARATSSAAAAATAWPAGATCAPTRSASASAATAPSPSTSRCR